MNQRPPETENHLRHQAEEVLEGLWQVPEGQLQGLEALLEGLEALLQVLEGLLLRMHLAMSLGQNSAPRAS